MAKTSVSSDCSQTHHIEISLLLWGEVSMRLTRKLGSTIWKQNMTI